MNTRLPTLAAALACGLGCVAVQAQDNVVKAGITYYTTNSSTTGIQGIGIPPGADAETGNAVTAIFVYERTLTPNIGVDLVYDMVSERIAAGLFAAAGGVADISKPDQALEKAKHYL